MEIQIKNAVTAYNFYRDRTREKGDTEQPINIYRSISNGFAQFIMKKVLDGYDVQLSGGDSLGRIAIRGKKNIPKVLDDGRVLGLPVSWPKTKKLWDSNPEAKAKKQLVYCFNEHSEGLSYKLRWYKHKMRVPNKSYYNLSLSRANKRAINKRILQGKEYLVITEKVKL